MTNLHSHAPPHSATHAPDNVSNHTGQWARCTHAVPDGTMYFAAVLSVSAGPAQTGVDTAVMGVKEKGKLGEPLPFSITQVQ